MSLPRARAGLLAALALAALSIAGCSAPDRVAAFSTDKLTPGTTYVADLDGDSASETILVDGTPASLTIADGDLVYHSREKWRVVDASLGDTDQDGLLEVVTLLDADDGRHLGLFAYFGGEYRERLVTAELTPRPLSLEVVTNGPSGDVIILTEEAASGQTRPGTVVCTWNGFGFTISGGGIIK